MCQHYPSLVLLITLYVETAHLTYHLPPFLLFFTIQIVLVSPSPSPSSSSTSTLSRPLFGDIVTLTLKSLSENTCEYSYIRTTHSIIIPLHSHWIGLNFSERGWVEMNMKSWYYWKPLCGRMNYTLMCSYSINWTHKTTIG